MGSDQQFCLRWHNYQSSLLASLPQLLDGDDLTDVTLSAGGRNLRAHRVVLSACSQYFKELFKVLQPLQHPVIVLPGANFTDLCALVTFMYSGEVNIYQDQLPGLLNMADAMQIRGLAEVNGSAAKLGANETSPTSKKEATSSSVKRAKLSAHSSVGSLITNQSPAAEAKLPQTDTVDIHGHFMKGKASDYEIYGGSASRTTKHLNIENDIHYANMQKEGTSKTVAMSENLDLFVESIPSKKLIHNLNAKTEPEDTLRRTSPVLGLSSSAENSTGGPRVKIEREHNNDGAGNSRLAPDLVAVLKRASGIEDMELGNVENPVTQAQQSPSSEDSGGGNFGADAAVAAANRIHLSPGLSLTGCTTAPPSRQSVVCPVCGRLISQRRNLNQHMRTHQLPSIDEGNNHAEATQVSVLPLEHVQMRYITVSRTSRAITNHQPRPPQQIEENIVESNTSESAMMSLEHAQPHYS